MSTLLTPVQVRYDERMLELSWAWLRDPDLRRLVDSAEFTREAQRAWFDSLAGRSDYLIWGVEFEGAPIGAFGLKHVTSREAEYWGYIGEKSFWGRGVGRWMLERARAEAQCRGLSRLHLRVLRDNARAIAGYKRFGFRTDSVSEQSLLMSIDV
jgi:RimJ/RimL family protein N-acetyltransferase